MCSGRTRLTDKTEREQMKEDVTLYFQLIGEMKGFIVQYTAHGERRLLALAARHKERLKVCVRACVCVTQGAHRKIVHQDKEQPLDGKWLTRCSSCCIQITVFKLTMHLPYSVTFSVHVCTFGSLHSQ